MKNKVTENFEIQLSNYSGPLEVLLELAKRQKVNLANISITQLADQFLEFINKAKNINLELASEYLLMATWLAYLKSKLLLPEDSEDQFNATQVAEKLKMQLKKLELIRLLSDQLLGKKRIGVDIFFRGRPEGIRSIHSPKYSATLFEILKSYSNFKMRKNFQKINIPKLPLFTTEEGLNTIRNFFGDLKDWRKMTEFIPNKFTKSKKLKKSGLAGIFAAALELSKEGSLTIKQNNIFGDILIKKK